MTDQEKGTIVAAVDAGVSRAPAAAQLEKLSTRLGYPGPRPHNDRDDDLLIGGHCSVRPRS